MTKSLSPIRAFLQTLDRGVLLKSPSGSTIRKQLFILSVDENTENTLVKREYEVVYFTNSLLLEAADYLGNEIFECLSKAEVVATYLNREIEVVDASDGSRIDSYFSG